MEYKSCVCGRKSQQLNNMTAKTLGWRTDGKPVANPQWWPPGNAQPMGHHWASIYEKSGDGIRNNISNSGIKSKIVGLSQK